MTETSILPASYAPGTHVLLDMWGASHLTDEAFIKIALEEAAGAAGATVLTVKLHCFSDSGGITGAALLAESHITIHTWPEIGFAALDVFLCGACEIQKAVQKLEQLFSPKTMRMQQYERGTKR